MDPQSAVDDAATVEISPLMSLWKRSPVPRRIVISGLDVSVSRLADGTLLVQGININPDPDGQENEFVKWLFGKDSIEVQDTTITWTDHKHRTGPGKSTRPLRNSTRTAGTGNTVRSDLPLPAAAQTWNSGAPGSRQDRCWYRDAWHTGILSC